MRWKVHDNGTVRADGFGTPDEEHIARFRDWKAVIEPHYCKTPVDEWCK